MTTINRLVGVLVRTFNLLMLFVFVAALLVVIALRWQAAEVLLLQFTVLEAGLLLLLNAVYYAGLSLLFALLFFSAYRRSLFKRGLVLCLFIGVLLIEGLAYAFAKAVGNGANAFTLYYLLTQFNLLHISYAKFVLGVLSASGFFWLSLVAAARRFYRAQQRRQMQLLIWGCIAINASLLPWLSGWPKNLSINAVPYLVSTLASSPRAQDFAATRIDGEAGNSEPLQTEKAFNVVLVMLESTRADALSIYNPSLKRKNPFFEELAKQSLVFDNAYAVLPFTVKSMVAMNCGSSPYLNSPILESAYGIPQDCLAHDLSKAGYVTRFAQSSTRYFGNKRSLTKALGYEEFVGAEDYQQQGFQAIEPLGFEDDIMLASNQQWLQTVKKPFFASYLTLGPHWPYTSYDQSNYIDYVDESGYLHDLGQQFNRYLNAVYHQDDFLQKLIDQFKLAGLYDNTIFIFVADHGQGFGEHRHFQHANNLYQEGIRVPLLIHAPALIAQGQRIDNLVSHTDLPQIIKNMVQNKPLLQTVDNEKVFSACWYWKWCIARTDKDYKYIYNFSESAEELYHLPSDSMERRNLAKDMPEKVKQYRKEALLWYYQQLAYYGEHYRQYDDQFYLLGHPKEPSP